jgi:site-specific DNA-cytosine methylase
MLIAKNGVPIPMIPPRTHGDNEGLESFVTVEDAFSGLNDDSSFPNMLGRTTNLNEGQHGIVRLHRCEVAPTIRCTVVPFHFKEQRAITVREAACLQSFPLTYEFSGNLTSQYKQVGNAVPVMLSRAIARSIKDVLLHEYDESI